MKLHISQLISGILVIISFSRSQEFEYSRVLTVPDLKFHPAVFSGLDVLEEMEFEPLSGLNIAILTNQTALNRKGIHLLDLLGLQKDGFDVAVIYTPQFGLLQGPGQEITISESGKDPWLGAPVKNLWEREFRPSVNDLADVDLIVVDIQDTGIRFSSFVTTVTKVMEVAAFLDIPVMVLDRPNPLNGIVIDGPVVRPPYQSFIGYHLVPIRHGLTVGEYALMINESGWIREAERVELTVVPMVNWKREMWMDQTGIPWVPPAPNIRDVATLLAYAGLGLIEATNLSCGVGTDFPYFLVGAPWMSAKAVLESLKRRNLPGAEFSSVTFTPDSLSKVISHPAWAGQKCSGVWVHVTDRKKFSPLLTAATLLSITASQHPHRFQWEDESYVDNLYGHDYLRIFLAQERDPEKLPATWSRDVIRFSQFRKKFLIY